MLDLRNDGRIVLRLYTQEYDLRPFRHLAVVRCDVDPIDILHVFPARRRYIRADDLLRRDQSVLDDPADDRSSHVSSSNKT